MPRRSTLALLLRALAALQVAAVAGWLAWHWPEAPVLAGAGALLIACLTPVVLALEFVLLAAVPQHDPAVPRPSPRQLARAWWAEVRQMARVFYGRLPWRWRTPADSLEAASAGRRGVVFVHGFVCNRGFWAPWMGRLRALGHPYVAVNLEPVFGPIEDYAPIVEDAVRRVTASSGLPPLLVCHSMGGLVARAWLRRFEAGSDRVARVVTIASPHHGTWLGRFSHTANGRQMRLDSPWLQQLARDEAARAAPPFTCWYSNCDNIVFPVTTARRESADNRWVPGRAHVELAFTPEVIDGTLELLRLPDAR